MDTLFRLKFVNLWQSAIKAGLSSKESRDYANLELKGELYHYETNQSNINNNEGRDGGPIIVSSE